MRMLATISDGMNDTKGGHYVGLPPEVTGGEDTRQKLGDARFLVIEENSDGIFLFRYGAGGSFVGDTWHLNFDDAKHQATYEYGSRIEEWADVPAGIEDVIAFGLSRLVAAQ